MRGLVDTSRFQLEGVPDPDEDAALLEREAEALRYVESFPWARTIGDVKLAIGFSWLVALFLVHFEDPIVWPDGETDEELWVVIGDLPPAWFGTDDSPNAAEALETYCQFMDDWVVRVRSGESLEGAYPVAAEPTLEHAEMLERRLQFIRENIIPLA